jgi:hypothetical protein
MSGHNKSFNQDYNKCNNGIQMWVDRLQFKLIFNLILGLMPQMILLNKNKIFKQWKLNNFMSFGRINKK